MEVSEEYNWKEQVRVLWVGKGEMDCLGEERQERSEDHSGHFTGHSGNSVFPFVREETEAQRGSMTGPRLRGYLVPESGPELS